MEFKEDLRIQKTRRDLRKSILELLKNNSLEKISVKEICDKYGFEINTLAKRTGNGKTTTKQPMNKTPQDIWNDLAYIDNNLVLFALMRKGITSLTEEAMKGVISEMNHGRSI